MALPYIVTEAVWSAEAADETKELKSDFSKCVNKVIEVITDGFSGTLDIQGSLSSSYDNINYVLMSQGAAQALANAQLSYSTDDGRYRYLIPEYYPNMRLVMTRTAGTITVNVVGIDVAISAGIIVPDSA